MANDKQTRIVEYSIWDNDEMLGNVANALSNPLRREIIRMISHGSKSIVQIAKELNVPFSTAAFHVRILVNAKILRCEQNINKRGNEKIISEGDYYVAFSMGSDYYPNTTAKIKTMEIPVGSYSSFKANPTCGMRLVNDHLDIVSDDPLVFYHPKRNNASVIWLHDGYFEYTIPFTNYERKTDAKIDGLIDKKSIDSVSFSLELCSEAPWHDNHYESDIDIYLNDVHLFTYLSPGDFGGRRGKYTPIIFNINDTQYGRLIFVEVKTDGTYLNNLKVSSVKISDLDLPNHNIFKLRFEVKKDAKHCGGMNIMGRGFGDYDQGIIFSFQYY